MGWLPIIQQGKRGGCHRNWPLFYMNDFSRLGLVVAHMAEALALLRRGGFTVHEEEDGALVEIGDQGALRRILQAFDQEKLFCEMSDVVSCVYQG